MFDSNPNKFNPDTLYSFLPKNKVLSMRWDDLDFNHYMWRDWPLSNMAVVLLENMAQYSDWVFVGRCKNHKKIFINKK